MICLAHELLIVYALRSGSSEPDPRNDPVRTNTIPKDGIDHRPKSLLPGVEVFQEASDWP